MNYDKYYGWFYIDKDNRSPSWTSVKYLNRFLSSKNSPGFVIKIMPVDQLKIGDVIQIRQNQTEFNHSVIITKITNREIYVCAHSYNAIDKPLSTYKYIELKGFHIVGINP